MSLVSFATALWLIPLLPLAAGVVCALLPYSQKRTAFALAVGALGASLLLSLSLLVDVMRAPALTGTFDFTWMTLAGRPVELGFLLNPLTAAMVAMVTFVSLLIFIYSHGYMHDDARYVRFFAFLSLFAGGMLGICVANSLLLLFASWELVGLSSYLLIGFWFEKPSAAAAAKKAFIVTKLGDIGFFIGILWLFKETDTQLLYDDGRGLLEAAHVGALAAGAGFFGLSLAGVLALLIFCGAVGKSGQFPLHVWLPDAMEGPTPVSALIHAATMVAAGVFLVARMYPLFEADPNALLVVTWVGAFTAILASTIAVAQRDIKRILAYSTVSQLGLMMLGLGAAGVAAGMFHLLTHAFFKALLFLGAGSVIHACHDEQDITKMGGLRRHMPITFATYIVGAAALAGVFPLAGFWSKDEILAGALHSGAWAPLALGLLTSFLTAFYMTRQVSLVFLGEKPRDEHLHVHGESPKVMTVPLVILAVFAVFLGFIGTPWANVFSSFLLPNAAAHAHHDVNYLFMLIALVIPLAGIALGWRLYANVLPSSSSANIDPLARLQPMYRWLENRWYIDELYAATIVRLMNLLGLLTRGIDALIDGVIRVVVAVARGGSFVTRSVDDVGVKPAVRGVAGVVRWSGSVFARFQSAHIQTSLASIVFGTGVLVAAVVLLAWLASGGGR